MRDILTRAISSHSDKLPKEFNTKQTCAKLAKVNGFRKNSAFKSRLLARFIVAVCLAQMLLFALYLPVAKTSNFDNEPSIYKIETKETATFYTGKEGKITIILCDQNGARVQAKNDIKATITATTLQTLEQAKQMIGSKIAVQQSRQLSKITKNRLVFPRGQQVAQLTMMHGIGEPYKDVQILSFQPGRLHIFVEAENITTGETVVVVLDSTRKLPVYSQRASDIQSDNQEEGRLLPIRLQTTPLTPLKLALSPEKPRVTIFGGEQVAYIKVELQNDTGDDYAGAPEDIKVVLEVEDGQARIEPNTLIIPKYDVITREQAALKSIPVGVIKVRVKSTQPDGYIIKPDTKPYTLDHGPCSKSLIIYQQRQSAIANGLDGIELRVEALQQDGRTIPPEEEGMEERQIFLKLDGDTDGVKFENEKGEVHIPKGQHSGTIKMFSTRSVSDLKVIATSRNGLWETIQSEATPISIKFSFPGWQLLFAVIGGAMFPLLQRQKHLKVIQGFAAGAILFALAFFGALVSNPQSVGGITMVLTKLPTENLFASLVLGFFGGVLLMSIFSLRKARAA